MKKDDLKHYLIQNCQGRDHAVSGERLRRAVRISENDLRKHVNRLRREGVPIASDQSGYYFAQTAGEVYATIRGLKKMRDGLDAAISGLEASMNIFERGRSA